MSGISQELPFPEHRKRRCQALQLTGDARNADPVCSKSQHYHVIEAVLDATASTAETGIPALVFRNPVNPRMLGK